MVNALTVIIPTAGRPQLLDRTLASLAACEQPPSYRRTIVVENGPKAGAQAVVQRHTPALAACYLHVPPANKSRALNGALDRVEEGLIVFSDDDVRFHPGVLCAYDAAAEVGEGQFYGGPTAVDYERRPPEWLRSNMPRSAKGWEKPQAGAPLFFLGFNWAAFQKDLRAVGGFRSQFGPGAAATGQEDDMQKRLKKTGCEPVFVSGARVWHYVPEERCSLSWLMGRRYRHGIAEARGLVYGSSESTAVHLLRLPWDLLSCVRYVLAGNRSKALDYALDFIGQLGYLKEKSLAEIGGTTSA